MPSDLNKEMLAELKEIRKLLASKPEAKEAPKGFTQELVDFISKYKLLGLAVAFIIGIYLGNLVKALVDDFIMPLLEYVVPDSGSWEEIALGPFRAGHFIGALITFAIVLVVIFVIVKMAKRWKIE